MPIYEFECEACGMLTEEFRNINDRERHTCCVSCGQRAHFIMSMPAAPVIGPGIYASSVKEHADARQKQLLKRSAEHDRTKGRDEIQYNTERAMRRFQGD